MKFNINLPLVGGKANVEGKLDIDDVELEYNKKSHRHYLLFDSLHPINNLSAM